MSEAGDERQGAARRRRRRGRRGSGSGRPDPRQATQAAPGGGGGRTQGVGPARAAGSPRARPGAPETSRRETGSGGWASARSGDAARRVQPEASSAVTADAQRGAHELADAQNEERRHANGRRLRALVLTAAVTPAIVLGVVVGVAVGVVAGAVVAAAVFFALVLCVSASSMAFALRLVGGTPVAEGALPALANQVEGLCATLGVAQPELRLVREPVANACALAGRGGRSVLVVTTGLLERLGLIEMEGVVAHELVHLRRRDAAVSSVAVATAGVVAWVTGRDGVVHLAVGRGREYGADQAAALAVRYPPGLHDALASMGGRPSGAESPFTGRRWAATRWIWIDPMVGAAERAPIGEIDATAVRMDALAER
jgi:heat shock protein HtpX